MTVLEIKLQKMKISKKDKMISYINSYQKDEKLPGLPKKTCRKTLISYNYKKTAVKM